MTKAMRGPPIALASFCLFVAASMLAPHPARAQPEDPSKSGDKPLVRSFVVEVSPLAPVAGRWGGSVQWLVAAHHALTASFSYVDAEPPSEVTFDGGGGATNRVRGASYELGYRFYLDDALPRGVWVAPSALLFHGSGGNAVVRAPELAQIGAALDVGATALLRERLVLSGGIGVEALHSLSAASGSGSGSWSEQLAPGDRYLHSHIAPRLLATVGVSF
jgi:hypothetical protein